MTVTGVEYKNASTVVSGRLTAGRFFGPENVEVGLSNGNTFKSSIGGVSMERVTAWPVLPEHDAILHLELAGSPLPLRIPEGAVVAGIGFAAEPIEGRRLANELMESPPFWASHYYLLSHDADRDETELCEELFGISPDALNEFYTSILSTNGSIMPWPYFQLRLPNSTFIEVEYADAAEYQTRYKLGDAAGTMIAGYNSGHFSLPAFRWCEIKQIARAMGYERQWAQSLLLLLPGAHLREEERQDAMTEMGRALACLGLFQQNNFDRLLANVTENLIVNIDWYKDDCLGWINEGGYSQRNPSSLLSTLSDGDFFRIEAFFAALE